MQRGDPRAKEFMRLFPDNTDWDCNLEEVFSFK